jgi:hypothetical protein
VDTRRPLEIGTLAHDWEIEGYVDSWSV